MGTSPASSFCLYLPPSAEVWVSSCILARDLGPLASRILQGLASWSPWAGWALPQITPSPPPGQKDGRPGSKFQLTFPLRTNYMYAKARRSLPEMYAFSVCMWLKSSAAPGVGTPFSYAVPGQANELVLIEWGNNPMEILINDKVAPWPWDCGETSQNRLRWPRPICTSWSWSLEKGEIIARSPSSSPSVTSSPPAGPAYFRALRCSGMVGGGNTNVRHTL